jgi:clan AA aspartic protease
MGITFTRVVVANPEGGDDPGRELELLVDTGALYSVVPEDLLDELGIRRLERQQFTLADGTHVAYEVGEARFTVGGRTRTSQVVFAPTGVTPLLGAFTLESLGLMVNPVTRELLPMRLLLARAG